MRILLVCSSLSTFALLLLLPNASGAADSEPPAVELAAAAAAIGKARLCGHRLTIVIAKVCRRQACNNLYYTEKQGEQLFCFCNQHAKNVFIAVYFFADENEHRIVDPAAIARNAALAYECCTRSCTLETFTRICCNTGDVQQK